MSKESQPANRFFTINKTSACSVPYDLPVLDAYGNDTGLAITILGDLAPEVVKADQEMTNKLKNSRWLDEKKGVKDFDKPKPESEEWKAIYDRAANRVIGWKDGGANLDYNRDLFILWLQSNQDEAIRILKESGDMRHFLTVQLPA